MGEAPTPKPTLREQASAMWKKAGEAVTPHLAKAKDVGKQVVDYGIKAAEEGSVATLINPGVREGIALGEKAFNQMDESLTAFGGAGDRFFDRVDQAGNYVDYKARQAGDSARSFLDVSVAKAWVAERAHALVDHVLTKPVDTVNREAVAVVDTFYTDKVLPVLDFVGVEDPVEWAKTEAKAAIAKIKERLGKKSESTEPAVEEPVDPRVARVKERTEGMDLIKDVTEGMEVAVRFDQLKSDNRDEIVQKLLGETEVAKKVGPVLVDSITGAILELANFDGGSRIEKAKEALKDQAVVDALAKNGVNAADVVFTMLEVADRMSQMRKVVKESRGKLPNTSWDHERRLTESGERNQEEAARLGIKILEVLPLTAEDLQREDVNQARATALALARKNRGFIISMSNIARSLEERFPEKVDKVRESWRDSLADFFAIDKVAEDVTNQVDASKIMRKAEGDLYKALIKDNGFFASLTKAEQDQVTAQLGATRKEGINGRNVYERYDKAEGSLYDETASAFAEYGKLLAAYEALREHVEDHPEAAGQLVVLAERVTQAKYALKLARNKMKAEITVLSKQILDKKEVVGLEASHTAQEATGRKDRQEYYTRILERYADRIANEAPNVKKIKKFLAVGGSAAIALLIGHESMPFVQDQLNQMGTEIAAQAPEVLEIIKQMGAAAVREVTEAAKFLWDNYPMSIKGTGLVIGGLGITQLGAALRERLGISLKKQAEENKKETEAETTDVVAALQKMLDTYAGDEKGREVIEEALAKLGKS